MESVIMPKRCTITTKAWNGTTGWVGSAVPNTNLWNVRINASLRLLLTINEFRLTEDASDEQEETN